jgi:hypothetical protein
MLWAWQIPWMVSMLKNAENITSLLLGVAVIEATVVIGFP